MYVLTLNPSGWTLNTKYTYLRCLEPFHRIRLDLLLLARALGAPRLVAR